MKMLLLISFLLTALLLAGSVCLSTTDAPAGIEGTWQGTLPVKPKELRLALKISKTDDGKLSAMLISLDQGAAEIKIDEFTCVDGKVNFSIAVLMASFSGTLSADGSALEGTFTQNGISNPLNMKRGEAEVLNRPQNPKKPYPYREEEVTYRNEKADITLAGTLTLPNGAGPFPAVLLITGSGAQDRDESLFGHHPFLVLADYLTRQGIAVLRVDDRGVGGSGGDFAASTTMDFAGDVEAGVAYLKTRTEINGKKIGLMGHSEGGLIAPMVAARNKDVAFIVLLAGPGVTGEEILLTQSATITKAMGRSQQEVDDSVNTQKRAFAILRTVKDVTEAKKQISAVIREVIAKLPEANRKSITDPEALIKEQTDALFSPWLHFFMLYDPRPALQKVKVPVLALDGEKDMQVAAKVNLAAIKKALKAGGNKDITTKELPSLNHLFQTCPTGSPEEYGKIEETFSPAALEIIGKWVVAHTKTK